MTCTLDLYTDYLISSTGQTSATNLSRLLGGALSHDQVTRWLSTSYLDSTQVWAQAKPLIRRAEQQRPADEFAVLIVDDSILEKAHTDPSALICTHWDHSQGRFVKGLNFVRLLYQAGELAVPIAVELIEKTEAVWDAKTQQTKAKSKYTKNEYLRAMLRVALPGRPQQQVAYRYLLADRWYASAENLNAVLALGHHFVVALESSRTVALSEAERAQGQFQAVDTLAFPDEQPLRVFLRSVQSAVLVTRQVFTNQASLYKQGRQSGRVISGQQRYKPESGPIDDDLPETVESRRIPQIAQTERVNGQVTHQNARYPSQSFLRRHPGLHQVRGAQAQMRNGAFSLKSTTLSDWTQSHAPGISPIHRVTSVTNRYLRCSKISDVKFRYLLRLFALDLTVSEVA